MNWKSLPQSIIAASRLTLPAIILVASLLAHAQTSSTRLIGSVASIQGDVLTVKTDAGDRKVQVLSTAVIKRVAPGQTDLTTAATIAFSALVNGDRVLVKLDPTSFSNPPQAMQVVVIKQEDVAQKQQKERDEWQRRGVGGLVKSIDTASGVIVISNGTSASSITVRTGKNTLLRRYAPGSVRFDESKIAPLSAILIGDQLRARGNKNADGSECLAEELVSGSFRNLSGLIASVNPANSSLIIKDLASKKQITVHMTAESLIRRLPENAASMLVARLKSPATAPDQRPAGPPNGQERGGSQRSGANPNDPQQMLTRLAAVPFSDLKIGEAIMVVATGDDGNVDAVTILAGVQALLEAPDAKNLLANWSMGSGESD